MEVATKSRDVIEIQYQLAAKVNWGLSGRWRAG